MLEIDGVVEALREELRRIDNALFILEGGARRQRKGRARGAGAVADNSRRRRRGRRLSAAVRRKISLAAKARWAAAKKKGRSTL